MKITKEFVQRFKDFMDSQNEPYFGSDKVIKERLQATMFGSQGYWSGVELNIYYNERIDEFYVKGRWANRG